MQTLDTLEVAKDLRAAGFTDAQAEALTRAVRKAQNVDVSTLATKSDLQAVKSDLRAEIQAVKSELQAEIQAVKAELQAEIQAVKADIQALRSDMKTETAALKSEIRGVQVELAGAKADALRWIIGAVGIQTLAILGTIVALARLLIH